MLSRCPTFHPLTLLPCHMDLVGKLGVGLDGHHWGRLKGQWYGCSGVPCGERVYVRLSAAGHWVEKGSYRTAWSIPPAFFVLLLICSYGQSTAIGPRTRERCWSLLSGLWRAIAPLMKPWCAVGDVPTAANLNLYR